MSVSKLQSNIMKKLMVDVKASKNAQNVRDLLSNSQMKKSKENIYVSPNVSVVSVNKKNNKSETKHGNMYKTNNENYQFIVTEQSEKVKTEVKEVEGDNDKPFFDKSFNDLFENVEVVRDLSEKVVNNQVIDDPECPFIGEMKSLKENNAELQKQSKIDEVAEGPLRDSELLIPSANLTQLTVSPIKPVDSPHVQSPKETKQSNETKTKHKPVLNSKRIENIINETHNTNNNQLGDTQNKTTSSKQINFKKNGNPNENPSPYEKKRKDISNSIKEINGDQKLESLDIYINPHFTINNNQSYEEDKNKNECKRSMKNNVILNHSSESELDNPHPVKVMKRLAESIKDEDGNLIINSSIILSKGNNDNINSNTNIISNEDIILSEDIKPASTKEKKRIIKVKSHSAITGSDNNIITSVTSRETQSKSKSKVVFNPNKVTSNKISMISSSSNSKEKKINKYSRISPIPLEEDLNCLNFKNSNKEMPNHVQVNNYKKVNSKPLLKLPKDYSIYDLQKLSYNISKEYSHLKIPKDKSFLDRMEFYSLKKQIKEDKVDELVEINKVKIKEKNRKETFNHLIEDANRRVEAKEQIDLLKNGGKDKQIVINEGNIQSLLSENEVGMSAMSATAKLKISSEDWNAIYKERFQNKLNKRNEKVKKERIRKEVVEKQEEEKVVRQIKETSKKVPGYVINSSVNRLYSENERRQLKNESNYRSNSNSRSHFNSYNSDNNREEIIKKSSNNNSRSYGNLKFGFAFNSTEEENKDLVQLNSKNNKQTHTPMNKYINENDLNNQIIDSPKIREKIKNKQKKKKYSNVSSRYINGGSGHQSNGSINAQNENLNNIPNNSNNNSSGSQTSQNLTALKRTNDFSQNLLLNKRTANRRTPSSGFVPEYLADRIVTNILSPGRNKNKGKV